MEPESSFPHLQGPVAWLHCRPATSLLFADKLYSGTDVDMHRPLLLSNDFIRTSEDKIDTAVPEQRNSNFSLLVSSASYIHKYLLNIYDEGSSTI
jgi:hypothetical protein